MNTFRRRTIRIDIAMTTQTTNNHPVQLMTIVSRIEARSAVGLEKYSGKEEETVRSPKRIGGRWISSDIRNLMEDRKMEDWKY